MQLAARKEDERPSAGWRHSGDTRFWKWARCVIGKVTVQQNVHRLLWDKVVSFLDGSWLTWHADTAPGCLPLQE